MNCTSTRLPYRQTGAFSKLAMDYIDQAEALKPFFAHPPTVKGLQQAIEARKQFSTNRDILVQELKKQYGGIETGDKVKINIDSLLSADTFTITTAHQNNIFTGPLYFVYKIVHAIKLADSLKISLPQYNFVPVFYIGSEDADLDELNHIHLGGEKLVWNTKQTGAVGRMRVDKELLKLITIMEGQLLVLPYGHEIVSLLKQFYKEGESIQQATFHFVNALFADYGLVVLLPDNPSLKKLMVPVFTDELLNQVASDIMEVSADKLEKSGYKVQASAREINLFYLKDDLRNRIELKNEKYRVVDSSLVFSEDEMVNELQQHPERFSPNVILRGLYEETILPNIAFIGGGGETAYWLQLKGLFEHYKVPYPVLILRNSFLVVEQKWKETVNKLNFTTEDFFLPEQELLNRLVARDSKNQTKLNGSMTALEELYESFKKQASSVDATLEKHVESLKSKTVYRLQELEKKMLRAEKRKFNDQQRQIHTVKSHLFPGNGLQERIDTISYYYAKWGTGFIRSLYDQSLTLEQEFVVLQEK
ncbi:MAG: bacillithiol biosynthesis cysteine-adding enzyme BshC [Chitinophagaceae bacterium]|nr:bacillithiol biosynthesis cysteine-adding enzyme BshC [Chitinophagaceae bacterium]